MRTRGSAWLAVARRLADEATLEELQLLDQMLKKLLEADDRVIAAWWHCYVREETSRRGTATFEKIKEKIRARGNQRNRN
jgi:hypothetical protein